MRYLVRKSQAAVEAAAAAVTEAHEEDATALADAIVSGDTSSSAGAVRRARTAEIERRDEAAAAKAAYDRLRVDVSGIAAEVERAERAVDVAMGAVLQPTARRLLDEAKSLRLKFLRRVYAVDTMRALLPPGFDEEKQRLLTLIAPELMAASRVVQQDWRAVIEALKADSDAPLTTRAMRKRSTRYRGKVCIHHPELGGLRYKCNWTCCECARVKRRGQVARAKLRQQDYVRRAECALEIVRELGLEDRL